ncbi:acetyl-CoA C-acyltransferase, partial [Klebsiella pneumoniae]|nr:acetyl-CoA C-acyltransferase [Klebsiella pneumoniae]
MSLGEATEQLAERHGITRERMDEFAFRSHQLTQQAWDEGFYDDLTVPVPGTELTRDESVRASSTVEKLGGLKT